MWFSYNTAYESEVLIEVILEVQFSLKVHLFNCWHAPTSHRIVVVSVIFIFHGSGFPYNVPCLNIKIPSKIILVSIYVFIVTHAYIC